MSRKTRYFVIAAAVGLSFAAAAPAHAELSDRVRYLSFSAAPWGIFSNQVVVPHDGEDWIEPADTARLVKYRLTAEAETTASKYKIRNAYGSVLFQGYGGSGLTVWPESQMHTYSTGAVTKLGPKDFLYTYLVNGLRARNTCKLLYNELRDQGMSHDEILSEDRVKVIDQELFFAIFVKKNNEIIEGSPLNDDGPTTLNGHHVWKKVWNSIQIKCLKSPDVSEIGDSTPEPPATADDFAAGFQVTDASLVLAPGYSGGEHDCPVDLTMFGRIESVGHGPAEVSYRFRWASGPVSTVFTTTIEDTSENKDVSHTISIPLPPAIQPPPQGSGGGFLPDGIGEAAGPGDDPVLPDPEPGPAFADHEIPGNVHKDSIRLEIVGPTKGVVSDWERYHVVCKPSVAPGLEPPDTVGIEPREPTAPETPRIAMPGSDTPERNTTPRSDAVPPTPGAGGSPGREPDPTPGSSVPLPGSSAGAGGGLKTPTR